MPLVFVHGVGNRRGNTAKEQQTFDENVRAREELFRSISFSKPFAATALNVRSPYWGDLGAQYAWNLASVPRGDDEALGSEFFANAAAVNSETGRVMRVALATTTDKAAAATKQPNTVLLTLAKEEALAFAIDSVVAAAAQLDSGVAGVSAASMAQFAARAMAYAETHASPEWLKQVANDNAFIDRLLREVDQFAKPAEAATTGDVEALGALSEIAARLKRAALRLGEAAKRLFDNSARAAGGVVGDITQPLIVKARPAISSLVGQFLGDIFVYLSSRGAPDAPGEIVKRVASALDEAVQARTSTDSKLVIVAHSMGGQIVYDILSAYRPQLECDLLVTVGSQVGFFEELKLLKASDTTINATSIPNRVSPPKNIKRWLNVFDLTDVLGFTEKGIFDGVDNFEFSTRTLPILSHSAYFDRPRFHERLHARMLELLQGEL